MALRRSKMREQVIQNLAAVAPPGERFVACIHCETGPSPWLNILFEEVPFLMLIVQLMRKYYFLTLTNGHLVVNRAGRMTNRPKEVVTAIPIQQVQISGIVKGKIWSRLYLQFPGKSKATRINFHRIWNSDVDHFIAMFPHAAEGKAAQSTAQSAGYAPQQQQGYQQAAIPQQGGYQGQPQQQQQYGQPAYQQQPGVPQQAGYQQQPQQYGQPVPQQQQQWGQQQSYPGQQQYPGQGGGYQR
jgi:hypothetical protein